jgi:hypothetical protein
VSSILPPPLLRNRPRLWPHNIRRSSLPRDIHRRPSRHHHRLSSHQDRQIQVGHPPRLHHHHSRRAPQPSPQHRHQCTLMDLPHLRLRPGPRHPLRQHGVRRPSRQLRRRSSLRRCNLLFFARLARRLVLRSEASYSRTAWRRICEAVCISRTRRLSWRGMQQRWCRLLRILRRVSRS